MCWNDNFTLLANKILRTKPGEEWVVAVILTKETHNKVNDLDIVTYLEISGNEQMFSRHESEIKAVYWENNYRNRIFKIDRDMDSELLKYDLESEFIWWVHLPEGLGEKKC